MRRAQTSRTVLIAGVVACCLGGRAHADARWLMLSDIHLDAEGKCTAGHDMDGKLLESAIRQMQVVTPDPPVVLISGDFVAHHAADSKCVDPKGTIVSLAKRFDEAFPKAQFAIALGNNDSDCHDYGWPSAGFLEAAAAAWEPLVNRRGQAPGFGASFAKRGSYVATLPHGIRLLVFDDVPWGRKTAEGCGAGAPGPAPESLAAWRDDARKPARHWAMAHIPPGVSVYESRRGKTVPLLSPDGETSFEHLFANPEMRPDLLIASHIHRFALRAFEGAPLLIVPSLSPIFDNAPSFLVLTVSSEGVLKDIEEYAFDGGRWVLRGDTQHLGLTSVDTAQVQAFQNRLGDPAIAASFWKLFRGKDDAPDPAELAGTRCAMSHFDAASYEGCTAAH